LGETALDTIERLVDDGSFVAASDDLVTSDPLEFPAYLESVNRLRASGRDESLLTGSAAIGGVEVELGVFDFSFLGGSMGEVAGERLARGLERAAARRAPFVLVTATGGARLQEGMRALVQMPKVVAARAALAEAHRALVALFGDPTTGGVLASIAGLADYSIATPGATIGFAGPRIVHRVTGTAPAAGSHTAESALANGLVDALDDPSGSYLSHTLAVLDGDDPEAIARPPLTTEIPTSVDEWAEYESVRDSDGLSAPDLLHAISTSAVEMRGDRAGEDDRAVVAALARIAGRRAVVLALDRALAPGPSAFRKARRAVSIAERLALPVVTLIDTRGADPSDGSESGGVAWEIAALTSEMLASSVPVLSVVTGEGGSGGALAFAVGDLLVAFRSSIFSVIGPEAAAEILWRDARRAPEAARLLKPSAGSLLRLGIADALIDAPVNADTLRAAVAYHLDLLSADDIGAGERAARRRKRWRDGGT
jgi:acyl-CoA carboxylase subunit beta